MFHFFAVLTAVAGLIVLLVVLIRQHRRTRLQQLRVRKLYASPVFEALYPMLKGARRHVPEQITVDKTGVLFRYLTPAGYRNAFLMKEHGFAYLTPDQQEAMLVVLEECLPTLRQNDHYRFSQKTQRLIDGRSERSYTYTMANSYKITLARSTYYDPRMEAKLR